MANGKDDWALIVGISRYPNYGPTPTDPNDLRGPVNDACAVADLLKNEYSVGNIQLLTSDARDGKNWPAETEPHPIRSDIENWIKAVIFQSVKNVNAGKGPRVGRRLYIYLAGHGLAPEQFRRALVTADAFSRSFVDHILATSWQEHLSKSDFFEEYVLWMDCCTQERATLIPSLPPFELRKSLDPPPRQVIACAARFPLEAIELPLGPNGEFHGVFTHELLRGLRGAASDPNTGGIRSKDLRGYLIKAVASHIDALPDRARLSREPDFLALDDIEFASPALAPVTAKPRQIVLPIQNGVVLADGTPITVLDHAGNVIGTVPVAGGAIVHHLSPGFYKLRWPAGTVLIEIGDEDQLHA